MANTEHVSRFSRRFQFPRANSGYGGRTRARDNKRGKFTQLPLPAQRPQASDATARTGGRTRRGHWARHPMLDARYSERRTPNSGSREASLLFSRAFRRDSLPESWPSHLITLLSHRNRTIRSRSAVMRFRPFQWQRPIVLFL